MDSWSITRLKTTASPQSRCLKEIIMSAKATYTITYQCDIAADLPVVADIGSRAFVISENAFYFFSGTRWALLVPVSQVIVQSLSDFPAPIANVITLEDNKTYIISGMIDVGVNRFQCGIKNWIKSEDRINHRLTSQTTGAMFTCGAAQTTCVFDNVGLSCPNGDLFSFDSCGLSVLECSIVTTESGGTLNALTACTFRNTNFANSFTTSGFVFTGTSTGRLNVTDNTPINNAGTFLALGTAVFDSCIISRNTIKENATQTFISGVAAGANITNKALIADNIFSGAGTFAATLTNADTNWTWQDNQGIANTASAQALDTFGATTDNATLNASTAAHGLLKKLSNVSTEFMNGVGNWATPASEGSIPAGIICMWAGLLANIPSGWNLCNGANGTPDLRDRFIKGCSAAEEPGATGGAATHTHAAHAYTPAGTVAAPVFTGNALGTHSHGAGTLVPSDHAGAAVADHGSHTHTYTQIVNHTHPVTDPGHTHVVTSQTATTGAATSYEHGVLDTSSAEAEATETTASSTTGISTTNPAGGVATGTTNGPSATLTHSVTQPSTHTMSGSSSADSAGTPAGTNSAPAFTGTLASLTHDSVNNEPTYFKLAYIQKAA